MLQKLRRQKHLMILWVLLSACATPPNFFACADLGDSGHCVEYMTKKKFDIDNDKKLYKGKKWTQVRAGSVNLPADQLAIIKTFFDTFCHEHECPNNVGDWGGFITALGSK